MRDTRSSDPTLAVPTDDVRGGRWGREVDHAAADDFALAIPRHPNHRAVHKV